MVANEYVDSVADLARISEWFSQLGDLSNTIVGRAAVLSPAKIVCVN